MQSFSISIFERWLLPETAYSEIFPAKIHRLSVPFVTQAVVLNSLEPGVGRAVFPFPVKQILAGDFVSHRYPTGFSRRVTPF